MCSINNANKIKSDSKQCEYNKTWSPHTRINKAVDIPQMVTFK